MAYVNKGCSSVTIRFLIGFLLLLLSLPLYAVQLEGLYTASVAVEDQTQSTRSAAIGLALNKVVQKVSGRRSALSNVALQAALSNVGSYVEQFQYKQRDDEPGYWLIIRFQKAALDRTLQQFDVPVWGGNRPDILLWLAVDDAEQRYIASTELDGEVAELVKQQALEAGLAVTLPLLDLADQRALSFNDVWAGFPDQLRRASQRYSVKQVMFGRLLKSKGTWRLNWTLMSEEGQKVGLEQSNDVAMILQQTFAQVSESLADIYAPYGVTMLDRQLRMDVSGVKDLTQFVQVTSYLSSLDMVKKLAWNQLNDNKVTLELTISGDVTVLKDIIALNEVLIPEFFPRGVTPVQLDMYVNPSQPPEPTLYYRAN